MHSIIKKLTFCALLGASMSANAAFVPFLDGNSPQAKEAGEKTVPPPSPIQLLAGIRAATVSSITTAEGAAFGSPPTTSGSFLPLPTGLTAGNGYHFQMDMRLEAGSTNIGGLKLEWQGGGGWKHR